MIEGIVAIGVGTHVGQEAFFMVFGWRYRQDLMPRAMVCDFIV